MVIRSIKLCVRHRIKFQIYFLLYYSLCLPSTTNFTFYLTPNPHISVLGYIQNIFKCSAYEVIVKTFRRTICCNEIHANFNKDFKYSNSHQFNLFLRNYQSSYPLIIKQPCPIVTFTSHSIIMSVSPPSAINFKHI